MCCFMRKFVVPITVNAILLINMSAFGLYDIAFRFLSRQAASSNPKTI